MEYRKVPIADIVVKNRVRKDAGDLLPLTTSIGNVGLLHPVVLNVNMELVAGWRRLEATKKLGWVEVDTVIVDGLDDTMQALHAERDENTCRKPFTASELAEAGKGLEELERLAAQKASAKNLLQNKGESDPEIFRVGGDVRDKVGEALGVSGKTYEKAKAIADTAIDALKAMVDSEAVSIDAASEVAKLSKAEQAKIVVKGPDAVKKAAKKAKTERQPKADKPKPEAKPDADAEAEQAEDPADLVERLRKALKADAEIAEPLSKELRDLSEEVASVLPVPTIDERIVALCRQLDSIAADMDGWKEDPLSYTISFITVQGGIKNVRTALWASRPCCECPYCKGTGKHPRHGEQCKGCKGTGLVTKTTEKSGKAAMGAA